MSENVIETRVFADTKHLVVNGASQGHIGGKGVKNYIHDILWSKYFRPFISTAYCVGLGPGVMPTSLASFGIKVTVAEPYKEILDVAEKEFLYGGSFIDTRIGDGEEVLDSLGKFNMIFIDAYNGLDKPAHLYREEFFKKCHEHLEDRGQLIINYITNENKTELDIQPCLKKIYDSVDTVKIARIKPYLQEIYFANKK